MAINRILLYFVMMVLVVSPGDEASPLFTKWNISHILPWNSVSNMVGMEDVSGKNVPYEDISAIVASNATAVKHCSVNRTLSPSATETCIVIPTKDYYSDIRSMDYKLLKYNLTFLKYDSNPLDIQLDNFYQLDFWHRTFGPHGANLILLFFNYDILSLTTLKPGTKVMDIKLVDFPLCCFDQLSPREKYDTITRMILHDFHMNTPKEQDQRLSSTEWISQGNQEKSTSTQWTKEGSKACHRTIHSGDMGVEFTFRCCHWNAESGRSECKVVKQDEWSRSISLIASFLKGLFILFCPLLLCKILIPEGEQVVNYKVLIPDKYPTDDVVLEASGGYAPRSISALYLHVEQSELITQSAVPVGLLRYIYKDIILGGIAVLSPFNTCCKESCFGTCEDPFLFRDIFQNCSCYKNKCSSGPSWYRVLAPIPGCLTLALVIAPYVARIYCYVTWEQEEIERRKRATMEAGLSLEYSLRGELSLLQFYGPWSVGYLIVYGVYTMAPVLLCAADAWLRWQHKEHRSIWDKLKQFLHEVQAISPLAVLRLFVSHAILPLEKCGLLACLLLPFYLIVILLVSIVITIAYCIPTFFLIGRLLLTTCCAFKKCQVEVDHGKSLHELDKTVLSYGVSNIHDALLLGDINPRDDRYRTQENPCRDGSTCRFAVELLQRILVAAWFLSLLFLYSECVVYLFNTCCLTLMGSIVNSETIGETVILSISICLYSCQCYNDVNAQYLKLNGALFDAIKEKRKDDIQRVVEDLDDSSEPEPTAFPSSYIPSTLPFKHKKRNITLPPHDKDHFCIKKKKLMWHTNRIAFFIDEKHTMRIPKKIFMAMTQFTGPGFPGPVHSSLLRATAKLASLCTFMGIVWLIVKKFTVVHESSTSVKMLGTLAASMLPALIRSVMALVVPASCDDGTYRIRGKMIQVMNKYEQRWPVAEVRGRPTRVDRLVTVGEMEEKIVAELRPILRDMVMVNSETSPMKKTFSNYLETFLHDITITAESIRDKKIQGHQVVLDYRQTLTLQDIKSFKRTVPGESDELIVKPRTAFAGVSPNTYILRRKHSTDGDIISIRDAMKAPDRETEQNGNAQ